MIKNTYDSLGRITGIAHSRGENILADYHYKWDAANRITEINDDKYGYDKTNQLLSAVYAKKPKEQYAYDLNGNRLTALLQGQEKKYETGKFNRLLSENGEKLEYDAEGNRIAKGDVKYEWDHRNRLVKVVSPSKTIEYTYDYQNRLVKRSADKNTTHFIHDGWQIVRQCENGKPVKRFLWGTKQDELLCDNDNWTLGDHLNTIREVVDASGKTLAHCDYNAFGKCLSPLKDLSFAYTGKMTDSATNLQWNINRWYDSSVGRWISEDPIGFKGKDENLYRYVGNLPCKHIDVTGNKVYAIDGTWSSKFSPTNTRLIYSMLSDDSKGEYREGPTDGLSGTDAITIAQALFQKICTDYLSADKAYKLDYFTIELLGWSRGAVSVVAVARYLDSIGCEDKCGKMQKPIKVKWIGLFDAVNQTNHPGWKSADMPKNIMAANHFKKTYIPLAGSNPLNSENWMDVINYYPAINRYWRRPDGSVTYHSDIGRGWPIYGTGVLWETEIGRSAKIAGEMITIMRSHGVKFK